MNRSSGILLPVSALPGPCGIGDLGKDARDFIDFLAAAGQRYWQILPLNPPDGAHSPYLSASTFAGSTDLLSPEPFLARGALTAGEVRAKVYSVSEMPVEGLPVQWRFSEIMGGDPEKTDLQKRQPEWTTDKHTLNSDVGSATITVVEAEGKTAAALNSWGYNNGHAYIKGLYYNDYWLMTIPVKYVASGTVLNAKGCFGGSGSAAAFFLLEYSADGPTRPHFTIKEKPVEAIYHVQACDVPKFPDDAACSFDCTFPVEVDIPNGNLYIRLRVSANIRITQNNTITTGGGGSNRLAKTWSVSVVE